MNKQSGKWKAESGRKQKRKAESGKLTADGRLIAARSLFRFPPSAFRFGTTLIELLVTITIIAILSAAFLGVSNLAMESAREARTKTIISKIDSLLMEKWNSYATRRVDIDRNVVQQLRTNIEGTGLTNSQKRQVLGLAMADLRLLATRELMKLEMPDRWSDLTNTSNSIVALGYPEVLNSYPALTSSFLRRYQTNASITKQNQGAECLYMLIMLSTGDGEARTLFSKQDIGDFDDDGAPEFLDGWGQPITFIRWPTGFATVSDLITGDADADHDPTDVFRRDQESVTIPLATLFPGTSGAGPRKHMEAIRNRNNSNNLSAFRLVPLIYSAGPDANLGVLTSSATVLGLDPYVQFPEGFIGAPLVVNGDVTADYLDNIHNHLQDNK